MRKKLLFLTSRFPYPLEKGDKLRAYHFIKSLSRIYDIQLFALSEEPVSSSQLAELNPYCSAIEVALIPKWKSVFALFKNTFMSGIPFQVAYFTNKDAIQKLQAFVGMHQPDVQFCHLIRMAPYSQSVSIKPSVLDYMDTFSIGMSRRAKKSNPAIRWIFELEGHRLAKYEAACHKAFDHHLIISGQDRDHLPFNEKKKVTVIPNGVDFSYYLPQSLAKTTDLIFLGNMSYPPNISSVQFAAKEIMPLLNKRIPDCKLLIAGANPDRSVRLLEGKNIRVSGWVEDPVALLNSSRIMIAPMLISIGLQNKILQAMALKLPCVISSLANNAIGAQPESCVLIADSPEEYVVQIERLLQDADLYKRIAENAFAFVREHFDWDQHSNQIAKLLD